MNITIERFEEIEKERQETLGDPNYIKWAQDLNVSRMYINPQGKMNARDMMSDYNFENKKINFNVYGVII